MKEIKLTRGKVVLVDDADFDWLNQWKWYARPNGNTFYAQRQERRKTVKMHRVILGMTDRNQLADHEDRNGLNNQRYNLRSATRLQNAINRNARKDGSSKYLGVMLHSRDKKYYASIRVNKKLKHLGVFSDELLAAKAYNDAAMIHHGTFANLNVIP